MDNVCIQLGSKITVSISISLCKLQELEHLRIMKPFWEDYDKASKSQETVCVEREIYSIEFLQSSYKKESVFLNVNSTARLLKEMTKIASEQIEIPVKDYFDYFCE